MKAKKMFSVMMAMVLWISGTAIPVSAESISIKKTQPITMAGSEASYTLKNQIEQTGVHITDESIIQLVSISSEQKTQSQALVITNETGNTVTKDVLMMVTDEGVGFGKGGDVSTHAGSTAEFPSLSWDGRYVVRGTAVYNEYELNQDGLATPFYQPIGAYFTYRKYESCTVSNITMLYLCDGYEYSYPGLEDFNNEIEYIITVEKSSPVASTIYSTTREYNKNRVIRTTNGSPFMGQFLTFTTVVDGESTTYTVTLY